MIHTTFSSLSAWNKNDHVLSHFSAIIFWDIVNENTIHEQIGEAQFSDSTQTNFSECVMNIFDFDFVKEFFTVQQKKLYRNSDPNS